MDSNHYGLDFQSVEKYFDNKIRRDSSYLLIEKKSEEDSLMWRCALDEKYSAIINISRSGELIYLKISLGLYCLEPGKINLAAIELLAANENLFLSGAKFGSENDLVTMTYNYTLNSMKFDFVAYIVENLVLFAERHTEEFAEKYDLQPLLIHFSKQSLN